MKPADEIFSMLIAELLVHAESSSRAEKKGQFYNDLLGDTSFLLAGLLGALLEKHVPEWNSKERWLDDSLITKVSLSGNKLVIEGVIVWGRRGTTEQWVDPFVFEVKPFVGGVTRQFSFSFSDRMHRERTYEEYRYSPFPEQETKDVVWKYILDSKKLVP